MKFIGYLSTAAIPAIIMVIVIYALTSGQKVFDNFLEGAKEGISTTVKIIPPLVGLMVAVGVFRASGALDMIINVIGPVLKIIGVPSEILALVFMKPVSGSASLAIVADIMKKYGPDSFIAKVACTIMGSTETIFYTLTIYFGSVGIKNIKYTLWAALTTDVVAIIVAVWVWRFIIA